MPQKDGKSYWVGFDLGGTKMLAAVFGGDLKPLASKRTKTKGSEGAEAGVARMLGLIDEALVEAGLTHEQLSGIGVGCPGPLDLDRGILHEAPNLGWKEVPLKDRMQKAFGCPAFIINDVDAGVYGEYRAGAARDAHCALGVFPGTGIGGGCVYEGKILRGKTNSCLEIGHLQIVPDGPLCGCGRRGCLEAVASRLAVSAAAAAAAYRGQAPNLLAEAGTDLANIRSGALSRSIKAGDSAVELIVRQAARHIGTAMGSVVNLLAPDIIVLGGGMVEAMPDLFAEEVAKAAKKQVLPTLSGAFKVLPAKLGDDAGVVGAAAWAQASVEGSDAKPR